MVAANVAGVTGAYAGLDLRSPAYAVCLWPQDELGQLDPYPISVGVDADRRRALASLSPFRAFQTVWNPNEFAIDGLEASPDPRAKAGFVEAEERLVDALEDGGCEEPAVWVLRRVADQLNAATSTFGSTTTEDFVVFVLDEDVGDDLLEHLRETTSAEVAKTLARKGLLPERLGHLSDAGER